MKKKARKASLPAQFWAVRWRDRILGPFTSLEAAQDWAEGRMDAKEIYNIYAPMLDEPNTGQEIGTVQEQL